MFSINFKIGVLTHFNSDVRNNIILFIKYSPIDIKDKINYIFEISFILYNINFRRVFSVLFIFLYKRKINLLSILRGVLKKEKNETKTFWNLINILKYIHHFYNDFEYCYFFQLFIL